MNHKESFRPSWFPFKQIIFNFQIKKIETYG